MTNFQTSPIKSRDITFDVMKGIGILSVIIGHCFGGFIHSFVYTFHIPLFFILSGYFWKQRPILEDVKKSATRLLLPVVFTQVIICLISFFRTDGTSEDVPSFQESLEQLFFCSTVSGNSNVLWGNFSHIGKIWFLAALFWAKCVYNLLSASRFNIWRIFLICVVFSLSAIYFSNFINLPWCFLQGLSCISFVAFGAIAKRFSLLSPPKGILWSIACLFAFIMWLCFVPYNHLDVYSFSWNSNPLINMAVAVIGTYFVYLFSKQIVIRIALASKLLSLLGYYSLVILCILSIKNMFPLPSFVSVNEPFAFAVLLSWKTLICLLLFVCFIRIPFIKRVFKV